MNEDILYILLVIIAFFARHKGLKQLKAAIKAEKYDLGLYYKIHPPLTGEKAIKMAKLLIVIVQVFTVFFIYIAVRSAVRLF